jgi:hypothetical protein
LAQQTGFALCLGGTIGGFAGLSEGHKRAQATIEEAKLPRGTIHGRQLYNNTLGKVFVAKVLLKDFCLKLVIGGKHGFSSGTFCGSVLFYTVGTRQPKVFFRSFLN